MLYDVMDNTPNPSSPQLNSKTVELPPDQSLRIVASTVSGRFLLLSVSDDPIYLGKDSPDKYDDFSSYSDVQIFSESIAFTGDLFSPHGISISCNDITISQPKYINASGAAGDDQVIGGATAKPGNKGGLINFYLQNGSGDVSKRLAFMAEGGKGGDVNAAGSYAGNGGDGGSIVRIFQSRYTSLLRSVYEFLDRKDVEEFDSPTRKNSTVYLATSQLLNVAFKAMVTEEKVSGPIRTLRALLFDIDKGIPCKVEALVISVRSIRNSLEDIIDEQKDSFSVAAYFTGGYGGSGRGIGYSGTKGKKGSDTHLFLDTYEPDVSKTTFAFAHVEQCTMLLDRAKIFYYMGSPKLLVQAETVFQRLVYRLSFLSTKVYKESDLNRLQSIRTDAANWLVQLATGMSFNGHPNNWVPRASYASYERALNAALDDHKAFEDAYIQYHVALSKQQKLTESVGLALQQTSQIINGLTNDINDLVERLLEVEKLVAALTDPVINTHKALMDKFEELKDRIRNDFELSVPQLVNALRSLAFSPTKGMAGVEGANLLYEGFTSVPDIEGRPANKDYIINKIKYGEATVKSIKDTLSKDQLDGEFKVDDPFGTRIMTAEEGMMSFLEAYANSSFADVIDEIKESFDAFIEAIVARNEQAILYNIQLKLYIGKIATRKDYETKKNELKGKEIEISNPNLPVITAYMADIYQSSRMRVMQFLDNFVRSLNFRMVTSYDIFDLAFEGTEPDKVPLTITSSVLRSGRSRIQDMFWKTVEIWGSEPMRFPPDFNDPWGKRIYLSESELADLKSKKHRAVVKIPVMYKDTTPKNDFSGCCNVRIYRVRFGLTGLVAKKRTHVVVSLKHSGEEIIVDGDNLGHRFTHEPVTTVYSFHLDPHGMIHVQDNGNIAEADVDEPEKHYAAPGPFADNWTVDLNYSIVTSLDFSNVTEAYFDFCGTNYAFF